MYGYEWSQPNPQNSPSTLGGIDLGYLYLTNDKGVITWQTFKHSSNECKFSSLMLASRLGVVWQIGKYEPS